LQPGVAQPLVLDPRCWKSPVLEYLVLGLAFGAIRWTIILHDSLRARNDVVERSKSIYTTSTHLRSDLGAHVVVGLDAANLKHDAIGRSITILPYHSASSRSTLLDHGELRLAKPCWILAKTDG